VVIGRGRKKSESAPKGKNPTRGATERGDVSEKGIRESRVGGKWCPQSKEEQRKAYLVGNLETAQADCRPTLKGQG